MQQRHVKQGCNPCRATQPRFCPCAPRPCGTPETTTLPTTPTATDPRGGWQTAYIETSQTPFPGCDHRRQAISSRAATAARLVRVQVVMHHARASQVCHGVAPRVHFAWAPARPRLVGNLKRQPCRRLPPLQILGAAGTQHTWKHIGLHFLAAITAAEQSAIKNQQLLRVQVVMHRACASQPCHGLTASQWIAATATGGGHQPAYRTHCTAEHRVQVPMGPPYPNSRNRCTPAPDQPMEFDPTTK